MFSRDRWCASWSLFRATFLVVKMSRFPMRECDDTYVYRIRRIVALVEVLAASRRGFEKRAYCWKRREAYMCEGIGTSVESRLTNRIIFFKRDSRDFPDHVWCSNGHESSFPGLLIRKSTSFGTHRTYMPNSCTLKNSIKWYNTSALRISSSYISSCLHASKAKSKRKKMRRKWIAFIRMERLERLALNRKKKEV